jgi:hypothetical protein
MIASFVEVDHRATALIVVESGSQWGNGQEGRQQAAMTHGRYDTSRGR